MRRLLWAAAPVALMAGILTGCGASSSTSVIDALQARHEAASRVQPFESLTDLLPNRTYRMGEGPEWSYSSSVVQGRITDVEPGRAYSAKDSPSGEQVPFDSSDAAWRTFHATIAVDKVIAGRALTNDERIGFAFGPDVSADDVGQQLKSLGTIVLFVHDSPVFDYAPNVLGTVWDGELVAQVTDNGDLTLPVLEKSDGGQLGPTLSVGELESAGRATGEHIQLDASGATVISRQPASK